MIDYKLLEALAAVTREGGFEKAARTLFITQSAVSQRVRLLEEQVGRVLLSRTSPPVPTAAGRLMLRHFRRVLRLENDLLEEMSPGEREEFASLPVGVNADSLATWFFEAVRPFLDRERVVLDLSVDDQEQTQRLLRDGEVIGCISSEAAPLRGCRADYLGVMVYRLLAAPAFTGRWFPGGLSAEGLQKAPALIFNRKDDLHNKVFRRAFGRAPETVPAFYVPSSERFAEVLLSGWAYGMLPDQQSREWLRSGQLVELAPDHPAPVPLYWHCWNIKSGLLDRFSEALVRGARSRLTA